MGTLFLTSTGLSDANIRSCFKVIAAQNSYSSVAIVTTAAEGKAENKYAKLAGEQLAAIGFETIEPVDLEADSDFDFGPFDVIYVCGGDTFKLLYFAKQASFTDSIKNLLARNGSYVGVSAGSLILCPVVDTAEGLEFFNETNQDHAMQGLGIIPFPIVVHYSPGLEKKIIRYEALTATRVQRIGNSQAVLLTGPSLLDKTLL